MAKEIGFMKKLHTWNNLALVENTAHKNCNRIIVGFGLKELDGKIQ